MAGSIRGWEPLVDGLPQSQLTVPFKGLTMDRAKYAAALEELLEEAFRVATPEEAQSAMEMSAEHSPNLAQIAMSSPPQDWPRQIMMSEQMEILLNQINYRKGRIVGLDPSEKLNLWAILEMI